MLLKQTYNLKLQQEVKKILCFSVAHNNTYVFVRMDASGERESIVHVDADGKVLFSHTYEDIINFFGQLNEKEVIVFNVPKSQIDIINLQEQKIRSINHQYLFEDVAQMAIQTFYDTRLFTVVEKGSFNDPRLRLTYYRYDDTLTPETCKPTAEFISVDNQWTYEFPVKKANNHSMITWWKHKHEGEIEFCYFSLRQNPANKQMTIVKVKNTIGEEYKIANFQISLAAVWETKPHEFMLVCYSNKTEGNAKNKDGVINNNYIVDENQKTIRESKFCFKHKTEENFSWNDQLIEYFYMGNVSVFHTFRHDKGVTLETPVFYVNNETEQQVAEETWHATCYVNFFVPGFDSSTVIEAFHENGDVTKIDITSKKVMDPKEISLHFLLHLNEDFDDDLLSDAIQLLYE